MIHKKSITVLFFIVFSFNSYQKTFSQCIDIESILVGACSTTGNEGYNEMVRFKTGSAPQNINNLVVTWPFLTWQGVIQSPTTKAIVDALNIDISAAGGGLCSYRLKEPPGGIIPPNSTVILVTSYKMDTTLNSFRNLSSDIYIIFQDNPNTTTGHFANSGTGTRTLGMTFGGTCSDSVTYTPSSLVNGVAGSSGGAAVLFNPAGNPTYVNNGCVAPVSLFTVDAGTAPSVCSGATTALSGIAQGQQLVAWTSTPIGSGTFSSTSILNPNFTVAAGVTGNVVLTLTATNSCGVTIFDTVTLNVTQSLVPTFTQVAPICSGTPLLALPTTSSNLTPITGTWSPALNNSATTTYTFTPTASQCANPTTMTIAVNSTLTPTFSQVAPICSGTTLLALPTTSSNLTPITGTWSPALNNSATTTYTFTPTAGQCANANTMTIAVTPNVTPTFTQVAPICSGTTLLALPTTSTNLTPITGTWSPALNNSATTTYTFTPTAGQCANPTTMTIAVNSTLTPTFSQVAPICSGTALLALPTTSTNLTPITGTWSPALNNSATTTYTFTPTSSLCTSTAQMTITVTPSTTPTFTISPILCSGGIAPILPTTSLNSVVGTWSPSIVNNITSQQYSFTPASTATCATNFTINITVQNNFDFTIYGSCVDKNFELQIKPSSNLNLNTATINWLNATSNTGITTSNFNASQYVITQLATATLPIPITATITDNAGCTRSHFYSITYLYCDIQKGISPNGDTLNDFFDLLNFNVKKLFIYNRNGMEVFSKEQYTNEWIGQTNSGSELPDGTYYYVIDFNNQSETKTGWIYINREH